MKKDLNILVINLGSTSTKIGYFLDKTCIFKENLFHSPTELGKFTCVKDQYDYRRKAIVTALEVHGIQVEMLDAVVSRGGQTQPIPGGVYRINDIMVAQVSSGQYGQHPTNLGVCIAHDFGSKGPIALTVDTPCTDEFEPLARYSGLPEISRRSSFHALNQKAVGRIYAQESGCHYEDLNLIVVHMGGGISVVAHQKGRMIDGPDALEGEGCFSTNRCGGLPVGDLIRLCFSKQYSQEEIMRKVNGNGGLMAYVGETDCQVIEKRATQGEQVCDEVLDAMCYQISKDIGAQATVLSGEVDAILFTGGMANSKRLIASVSKRVSFIAPTHIYPGEFEMEALCSGAYRALTGASDVLQMGGSSCDDL